MRGSTGAQGRCFRMSTWKRGCSAITRCAIDFFNSLLALIAQCNCKHRAHQGEYEPDRQWWHRLFPNLGCY